MVASPNVGCFLRLIQNVFKNICSLNLYKSVTVMIVFRKIRLRSVDITKGAKTVAVLPDLSGCSQIFLASSKKIIKYNYARVDSKFKFKQ